MRKVELTQFPFLKQHDRHRQTRPDISRHIGKRLGHVAPVESVLSASSASASQKSCQFGVTV